MFSRRRNQAERLASVSVCDTQRFLARPGEASWRRRRIVAGLSVVLSVMCGWKNTQPRPHTRSVMLYSPRPGLHGSATTLTLWNVCGIEARTAHVVVVFARCRPCSGSRSVDSAGRNREIWECPPLPYLSFCSLMHRQWPIAVDRRRQHGILFFCLLLCACMHTKQACGLLVWLLLNNLSTHKSCSYVEWIVCVPAALTIQPNGLFKLSLLI